MRDLSAASAIVCFLLTYVVEIGVFHHKAGEGGLLVLALFIGAVTYFGSKL